MDEHAYRKMENASRRGNAVPKPQTAPTKRQEIPISTNRATRNGVPLLPVRPDAPKVTPELIRQLEDQS